MPGKYVTVEMLQEANYVTEERLQEVLDKSLKVATTELKVSNIDELKNFISKEIRTLKQ